MTYPPPGGRQYFRWWVRKKSYTECGRLKIFQNCLEPKQVLDEITQLELPIGHTSRVGLTPAPTCPDWQGGFPKGDVAKGKQRSQALSALLGNDGGFIYVCTSLALWQTLAE